MRKHIVSTIDKQTISHTQKRRNNHTKDDLRGSVKYAYVHGQGNTQSPFHYLSLELQIISYL